MQRPPSQGRSAANRSWSSSSGRSERSIDRGAPFDRRPSSICRATALLAAPLAAAREAIRRTRASHLLGRWGFCLANQLDPSLANTARHRRGRGRAAGRAWPSRQRVPSTKPHTPTLVAATNERIPQKDTLRLELGRPQRLPSAETRRCPHLWQKREVRAGGCEAAVGGG